MAARSVARFSLALLLALLVARQVGLPQRAVRLLSPCLASGACMPVAELGAHLA